MMEASYGHELILDLHDCDITKFNRFSLKNYFEDLCKLIEMERCDLYFWDDQDTPEDEKQTQSHTVGTSAVQFILTSNIVIHTLPILRKVFINIFSCKDFDALQAALFSKIWFKGKIISYRIIERI